MTETVVVILYIAVLVLVATINGAILLVAYMCWRMMRNPGWDDSNVTNALRLLSHVVLHPHDFGRMYYITHKQLTLIANSDVSDPPPKRPFWYTDLDELSEVVRSRPGS